MAFHVQAPPTTGAVSLGVSVFVPPIEARPPLCLRDPRGQPNSPRPTTAHSSVKLRIVRKTSPKGKVHSERGGGKAAACTQTAAVLSPAFQSHKLICAAAFCSLKMWRKGPGEHDGQKNNLTLILKGNQRVSCKHRMGLGRSDLYTSPKSPFKVI